MINFPRKSFNDFPNAGKTPNDVKVTFKEVRNEVNNFYFGGIFGKGTKYSILWEYNKLILIF